MNDDKIISYWQNMFSKPDAFGTGPTKLAKLAQKIINDRPVKNILEIGCGQGRDAIFFSQLNYIVDTFDISKNAVDYVNTTKNSLNLKNINAIIHDVQQTFPYSKNYFNFIYSNLALQFFDIKALETIFDNMEHVMNDDGLILFSTKKQGDKYFDFGNKISEFAFEHKGITRYFYEKPILENLLTQKFEILNFEEDKHVNPNSTISEWWKILLKKK
ncbi:MAG: hypothetical protein CXT78_07585 [Thaumarchaeota archaeon]|jgi:cyclopropane fatty-acyl-phospholipid synthase-like methyltransferase|nr:MAG: hypothetical protein CXT78_07585 [Nitrososphaerota archaeon]